MFFKVMIWMTAITTIGFIVLSVLNIGFKQGADMDTEDYVIYGMIFGFITLWLLFSLAKTLGGSEKFSKPNKDHESENKE